MARGHGPSTCFITPLCIDNWWPDLRRILDQLETKSGDTLHATKLRSGDFKVVAKSAQKYPGFSMKCADIFMKTIVKDALWIEHYWKRVKFSPGRGQIHLHTIAIGKNKVYLEDFYKAQTIEDKAKVIDEYANGKLNMTADIGPFNADPNCKAACMRPKS